MQTIDETTKPIDGLTSSALEKEIAIAETKEKTTVYLPSNM